jgi:hypothetical protein
MLLGFIQNIIKKLNKKTMNRKALCVGINDYKKHPLKACINDACVVADLLKANGDQGKNFDVTLVKDVSSKAALKAHIVELFRPASEIALFYFSGHGIYDSFGHHLMTPDYANHDLGVSMSQLYTIMRNSPAKNKVVILDCCYAGDAGNDFRDDATATYLKEGVTILASSKNDQLSYEVNGHGVFTNLLIEALKGGAADLNGDITAAGIYAFIDKALGEGQQRPIYKTNISKFISLRKVKPQVSDDIIKTIPMFFATADTEYPLNRSYEETNYKGSKHFHKEPYAIDENVKKFKKLQQLQSIGLVVPVNAEFMYWAAMNETSCKLTAMGKHYWSLASKGLI